MPFSNAILSHTLNICGLQEKIRTQDQEILRLSRHEGDLKSDNRKSKPEVLETGQSSTALNLIKSIISTKFSVFNN